MASLIVIEGTDRGDFFRLEEGVNAVGRSPDLAIHLADMTVSRRHMEIRYDRLTGRYRARDLGSTHGVFINGSRIREDTTLVQGDCLAVGRVELLFTKVDVASREHAEQIINDERDFCPTMDYRADRTSGTGVSGNSAVRSKLHRLRQWAGSDRTTLAIAFTDLVDSTRLAGELGNSGMDDVRRAHFARTRAVIDAHRGYEIKTNGDEFMVAFRTAVDTVDFMLDLRADPGHERLRIRAGAHLGPVVIDEEDLQGAAVAFAARVVARAGDGGLWVSADIKNHLDQEKSPRHRALVWRCHRDCELKGFPGVHSLWSVNEEAPRP